MVGLVVHALLTPVGSSGDVDPYLMIGQALRRRGHEVSLLAPEPFEAAARAAGLEFVSSWSAADYDAATHDPDLWHPQRGLELVLRVASEQLRAAYALVERCHRPGRTLLVGHTLAFATRIFEEKHAVPAATLQLAPSVFRSLHRQSVLPPGRDLSRLPRWLKRGLWWAVDRFVIDPKLAPAVNALRGELGLAPVSRLFAAWIHSPQRVLGLFPPSFGQPQPDWPPQLELTGFVLSDSSCAPRETSPERLHDLQRLERFLAAGDPPLVFTPGSANRQADAFFRAALEASERLRRRALFVTGYAEQIPAELPASALHVSYAPFATLFRRAAAVCHHGGVGTCAQGLAAGVPQLVRPLGFDQYDNAARLARLGTGAWLAPRRFTGERVAAVLEHLLASREVASACTRMRAELAATPAVERTCDALERVFAARRPVTR